MLEKIIRLYVIHVFALIATVLGMYYPGMDILVGIIYLAVLAVEALRIVNFAVGSKILIALIWQLPGLVVGFINISRINLFGLLDYSIFILELWYTPVVGILSLTDIVTSSGKPLYYLVLRIMPLLSFLYYLIFSMLNINMCKWIKAEN